ERVDQETPHGLGVNGSEMSLRQQIADEPRGISGVHEIVDYEQSLASEFAARILEKAYLAPLVIVVARDAHRVDQTNAEFSRDDRSRHEAPTRDGDDCIERSGIRKPPRECTRVAMELVPGDRKGSLRRGFRIQLLHLVLGVRWHYCRRSTFPQS